MTDGDADSTEGGANAATDGRSDDATEDVLRVLYQAGIGVSPTVIEANLAEVRDQPPDERTVRSTIDDLEADAAVRELDAGDVYVLTETGRNKVEAEIDAEAPGYVD